MSAPIPEIRPPSSFEPRTRANDNYPVASNGITSVAVVTPLNAPVEISVIHVHNDGGAPADYELSIVNVDTIPYVFHGANLAAGGIDFIWTHNLVVKPGQTLNVVEAAVGGNLRVMAHGVTLEP